MRRGTFIVLVLASLALPALGSRHGAAAETLVADLSEHRIQITTGFIGTDVVLFGAVESEGDVVVVVRGPEQPTEVWRKGRYGGIWLNDKKVVFERVPSFYAVGSNRPLFEIADEAVLDRHQIGVERLKFEAPGLAQTDPLYILFRQALIRNKQIDGTFAIGIDKITFVGARLFRTRLLFPANVPTGIYYVEVFLLRDGQVVSAQTTPLQISKAGFSALVFFYAHQNSAAYGIIAVLTALLAGSLAAYVFRKS